jgi:hypothetical protein
MKKVKLIYCNKQYFGFIEEDKHFLGGKKVIFDLENNTGAIISINLVKIIEDEYTGSARS